MTHLDLSNKVPAPFDSLAARLCVEVFDSYKVSLVPVTQQFNTTTSMGRLAQNVLWYFTQFEREQRANDTGTRLLLPRRKGM
jgi:DNA invertase Pin-like site-specific DNA recombinase